jgi:hypothetical protein
MSSRAVAHDMENIGAAAHMSTMRTDLTFRVDTWTPDGESIVEHVAGIEDYQVALTTYFI